MVQKLNRFPILGNNLFESHGDEVSLFFREIGFFYLEVFFDEIKHVLFDASHLGQVYHELPIVGFLRLVLVISPLLILRVGSLTWSWLDRTFLAFKELCQPRTAGATGSMSILAETLLLWRLIGADVLPHRWVIRSTGESDARVATDRGWLRFASFLLNTALHHVWFLLLKFEII